VIGELPVPAPFTSVAADGWQATKTSPTDLSLAPFTVRRAGFNASGGTTTYDDTLLLTKRVRQVHPNSGSFTTDKVAVSDYIYAADTLFGATNNSTIVSPKPIATWGMMDRTLVGNAIAWEIIPFHRDARLGRQAVCAAVRATDGTNTTSWQYVSALTLSTYCEGAQAPEVFAGTLDITALNNNATITLQGQVFPWLGVSASVLESNSETEFRFSNRFFYKSTGLASAPNLIYVSSSGNDATAVVSTNAATAKASPALTVGGAITRLAAVLGSGSTNVLSGSRVRITNGVNMGSVSFGTYRMDGAGIIVERDPDVSRATANVTWNSADVRLWTSSNSGAVTGENGIIFEDLTITRSADVGFLGEGSRRIHAQFRNVDFNWSSTGAAGGMMTNAHLSIFGMAASNFVGGLAFTSNGDRRIIRGLTGSFNNTAIEGYNVIGCNLAAARIEYPAAQRGFLIYNNNLPSPPGTNSSIFVRTTSAGQNMAGAVVQNVIAWISSTSNPAIRIAGDSDNGNLTHLVCHHNTVAGVEGCGRYNVIYDDTVGTARTHTLVSFKGNIGPQFNTKGDVFMTDGTRIGNFPFHHGVGCAGNFARNFDSGNVSTGTLSFGQAYAGIGSVINGGSMLFVDDRSTTLPGPSAGSSGGNYDLQSGSPAKSLFSQYLLARDFAAAARATTGTVDAGAYA